MHEIDNVKLTLAVVTIKMCRWKMNEI